MDFELPGEDHPKRQSIRAWFDANPHPSGSALAQAGFVVPHWPRPWGLEADAELQLIIDQEMKRAGTHVPRNPVAINNCAQSLLTHGTEAQRQHFLWPALSGEHTWCMLFSEPSGGSDLGALRTVARRDGDHYVVKGHKIWTSLAHKAKVGVLVARTDPDQPKHKGLSEFLVDMDMPGIRIRPIIDMSAHGPVAAGVAVLTAGALISGIAGVIVVAAALGVRYLLRRREKLCDAVTVGTAAGGLILAGAVLSQNPWRSVDGYVGHSTGVQLLALISVAALAASVVAERSLPLEESAKSRAVRNVRQESV